MRIPPQRSLQLPSSSYLQSPCRRRRIQALSRRNTSAIAAAAAHAFTRRCALPCPCRLLVQVIAHETDIRGHKVSRPCVLVSLWSPLCCWSRCWRESLRLPALAHSSLASNPSTLPSLSHRSLPPQILTGPDAGKDFYAVNPAGNVPALVLADGTLLNQGAAVLQWIADNSPAEAGLAPAYGTSGRYLVQNALNQISSEIHANYGPLL